MAANIRIGLDLDKSRFDAKLREAFNDTKIFSKNGIEAVMKAKIDYSDFADKSKLKRAFTRLKKDFDAEWRSLMEAGFKNKSGKAYDFGNFANVENEYFRLLTKQKKGTLSDSREIEMFDRLTAVMQKAAAVGSEYNRVAERRQKLNRASDNAVKEAAFRREARELTSVDAAMRKVIATQKELARERVKHVRGGSQWLSSINRQINMYHDLEVAARQAGDAKYADFIRQKKLPALNAQADAIERVNKLFGRQGTVLNGLRGIAARYFSIYMVADFARKVAETTGYFQQQKVALEGILGSASKANAVLNEIKSFALQSPFQTKDLVTFTKQLAAFGVDNNELFPTVKKLADISAGLGVDMARIILAYGQVKSAAVLRGQELRQFTEAGIPMVQALADKFTALNGKLVTTGEVFKLISERKVPFEMVASVLADMTAEGGKFYKMQESITDTTYGQIQKLRDLWTLALDDIGKSAGGFINGVIKGMQKIVKNIQPIAVAITTLVAGRGLGRAVSMVVRLARAFRSASVAARLMASGLVTSVGGAIGVLGGIIAGFIWNANRKSKELDRRMNEIASSYAKDTQKMCDGLDMLAQKITTANIGTKKYADAVSALAANYSKFVSTGMTEALRGQRDAASAAADEFLRLSDSIKEAIRQSQQHEAQEAQAKEAASAAAKSTGEKAESTPWYNPEKANILQTSKLVRYVQGAPQYEHNYLEGVKAYAAKNNVTVESLVSPISKIIQDAIEEAAAEGYDNKTEKGLHNIKALFAKRISEVYKFDAETIGTIVNNAVNYADWEKYQVSLEKYAAASATTYGKIKKPFDVFDKKVASGQIAESTKADNIEKEVNKEVEVLVALRKAMKAADIKTYSGSDLEKLINSATPQDNEFAYKIVQGIDKFREGRTEEEKALLYQISQMFSERVAVRSDRAARIAAAFRSPNSVVYKWRQDEDLKSIVATYGAPTNETVEKLRERLGTDKSKLQSILERSLDEQEKAKLRKQIQALTTLQGASLYAMGDKPQKGGGGSSGGWQRFLADLFSYIKEARAEEKKLVEHSAGLTEDLAKQIGSYQLEGTAVDAFWESMQKGVSPFKRIIDKMDEYGIESKFFDKEFLKGALSNIVAQSIESTGTVDYQNVWQQLIQVINKRADELLKNSSTKKLGENIKAYAQQATVEGDKFFGRSNVDKLIEDQLKELRKINGQFENIRNTQKSINNIRSSSNAYRAYAALGNRGYASNSEVTRLQLQALLASKGGQGLSLATPLARLVNGGSVGISSIAQILAIKQGLAGITTKDMLGDDEAARQANFKEFQGVLGQFDNLLGQLVTDIEEDFKRLMAVKDPTMRASDEILNSADEFSKALELISKGLKTGDIKKDEADDMRLQALQNLYGSVSKGLGGNGMPDFINRLFGLDGTATGVSALGSDLGMWLNNGSLSDRYANMRAQIFAGRKQDLDYELERGTISQKQYDEQLAKATKEAADATLNFSAKMQLTSSIISKVDSYIQKSAKFANDLIGALEANNGLTKDQYGNYTYENDYSDAKAAINMIADFSSGISGAFQSLMSGDIFGALMGVGSTIAKFFENLFGLGDSQIQKQQDQLISSNKALQRAMGKLQNAINDLAGKDKWDNLTEQIGNLRDQEANNRQLESLEVSKKHGDADKAEAFRNEADEAEQQVKDIVRSIREQIFGTADELASTLTDAMVEAFRNGENAARAWRDSVRSYIGDVLKEVLMTNVIAPKIQSILESFGIKEGETSAQDILSLFMDPSKSIDLKNQLFAAGDELQDWFNNLAKPIQEMIAWNSDTSVLSGGIQAITEDTARTLEGLSYSMLAQLVLIQRSVLILESSGFAQVQTSWFNDMLTQQRALRQAADSINGILEGSRDGTRSLQVRIE